MGCMEKKETEGETRKRKFLSYLKLTTITILYFFAVVKVDSRRCICKGVLWGSLSMIYSYYIQGATR